MRIVVDALRHHQVRALNVQSPRAAQVVNDASALFRVLGLMVEPGGQRRHESGDPFEMMYLDICPFNRTAST
jgi:hypothetical protein